MDIRRKLNAMSVPSRGGGLWAKSSIEKILTFESYATGKILTTLEGETFEIPCTPIISKKTWEKAKKARKKNRSVARNSKEDYLCTGLIYCVCGWKCHPRATKSNRNRGYDRVNGNYICQRRTTDPESMPPDCVYSTGSQKVDDYVWKFVKLVCRESDLLQDSINKKLTQLETEQADLEAEAKHLQGQLEKLAIERQWTITQARKGSITEEDMNMQLGSLQLEEVTLRKELDERNASVAAQKQAEALSEWAKQYLTEIHDGLECLDIDPETLDNTERQALFNQLEAGRFKGKFPDSELAQLRWAILEEKRRAVRTIVKRVIVGKGENGQKRKIVPILNFQLELPSEAQSLVSGHQSPDYKVPSPAADKFQSGSKN
jgi:hypothetical protein